MRLVRPALWLAGSIYGLVGAGFFFAPTEFYSSFGHSLPFMRHYAADLGAFLLPMGVGLVRAARSPEEYRPLVAVAGAGSVLHALNHLYDRAAEPALHGVPLELWVVLALALLLGAASLVLLQRAPVPPQPYDRYEAFRLNHEVDAQRYRRQRDWPL